MSLAYKIGFWLLISTQALLSLQHKSYSLTVIFYQQYMTPLVSISCYYEATLKGGWRARRPLIIAADASAIKRQDDRRRPSRRTGSFRADCIPRPGSPERVRCACADRAGAAWRMHAARKVQDQPDGVDGVGGAGSVPVGVAGAAGRPGAGQGD